ncbi:UDP-N-acetylmuramoyl-L-alanine--D-glutamate ligase [Pseudanabaena sp. FACHB-2040]|uniref:UDP-N-acetylmuramoyl-L-alanine--D-glutamate ligase n=1 Tax=Pseudanabaena sp. FACHB-2040 TaxID=2692859 RepID=UPI001684D7AA|nr:UDP-N-acetylmuramoyl-L-alanine--D-glutamate ligase [Pseudanabaena sp. FACHB-2040]MBD2257011.1 UDP-N-acetylmuramoyl-L-alanine--D-glutamate ligase [Pseudanabaena sp. FACHB-2040]
MNNAHVIGLGKSGIAAARVLHQEGWQVVLSDRNSAPLQVTDIEALQAEGITVELGHSFVPDDTLNLLVVSPGVPWDAPALNQARDLGIEVIGETELAWRTLEDRCWVGVTGTNGKTTTTALIAAIFQAAGYDAPACGNIGYATCELALRQQVPDWIVAELSSYQIEASPTLAPRIGVWTTFTPDHLQRHQTLENYFQIKAALLHRSEYAIFNGDDLYLREHVPRIFGDVYWTSVGGRSAIAPLQPTTYIEDGWVKFDTLPIVRADALKMVGSHNLQNLLMAVTAACLAEINEAAIAQGVANFPGVPHRLEHICTWQGINFVNDSKATNYDAAEVGLRSVAAPVILIAGGEAKAGDDTAWMRAIQRQAAQVLLIGSAAPAFAQRLEQEGFGDYEIVETMERAVERSAELALQDRVKTVLLSPACASFDQYPNFEVRGDHFRQLCLERFQSG